MRLHPRWTTRLRSRCMTASFLIIQPEMPKRNDIHIAKFCIIFNDKSVRNVLDLQMALFPATDFESIFPDDKV